MFMGSFRGVYPRKTTKWRAELGDYWNYNIDHLGKYDLSSFITKIIDVKTKELLRIFSDLDEAYIRSKIKITYIGHSMGGMVLPIYLIHKRVSGENHHISRALLMSPAGFHSKGRVTPYLHHIGKIFYHVLPMITSHFCVPDSLIGLLAKLH